MPRQKSQALQPHPLDHIDDEKLQADFEVLGKLGPEKMRQESLDAAARSFLAGRISGSVQAGRRMAKLNEQVSTLELAGFKEQKLYKGVIVPGEGGGTTTINTWEQYCDLVLGISKTTADEQILNLKALGDEVFTLFEEIGLAKSLVTNFRRIPQLERDAVLEDLREHRDDPDHVEDVVRALVEKQEIKEAGLRDENKRLDEEVQARDRIIEDKDRKINEQDLELRRRQSLEDEELIAELNREVFNECLLARAQIARVLHLMQKMAELDLQRAEQEDLKGFCYSLCESADEIRWRCGFPVWMPSDTWLQDWKEKKGGEMEAQLINMHEGSTPGESSKVTPLRPEGLDDSGATH